MIDDTVMAVGRALVEANNTDSTAKLLDEHYSQDVVSREALDMPGGAGPGREVKGLDALREKHAWWETRNEVHSTKATGPFFHAPDRFSVLFELDATDKETGARSQMHEVALYRVENGKVASEEFFYAL